MISKITIIFVTLFIMSNTLSASEKAKAEWSYQGESGPQNWSKLSEDYYSCNNGLNQSPINITKAVDGKLPAINYDYSMIIGEQVINNGHTIQVDVRSGGTITVNEKEYTLKQFHYHSPSENHIKGKSFPLEVHFVHANADGELAVVAMMYKPGAPDPLLNTILSSLPLKKGQSRKLGAKSLSILETSEPLKHYIRFNGSLTTPPCSEGVIWIVKKAYLSLSMPQLIAMQKALVKPNNRPIQNTNARVIID